MKYSFIYFFALLFCFMSFCYASGEVNKTLQYAPRKMAVPLTLLPRGKYGLIDWAESVRNGIIEPLPSIDGQIDDSEPIDLIVYIKSKRDFMTDVLFPHSIHTYWLSCKNCHPAIFVQKKGENKDMTMWAILRGEYCGRCHGKIAFPIRECYRCHMERSQEEESIQLIDTEK